MSLQSVQYQDSGVFQISWTPSRLKPTNCSVGKSILHVCHFENKRNISLILGVNIVTFYEMGGKIIYSMHAFAFTRETLHLVVKLLSWKQYVTKNICVLSQKYCVPLINFAIAQNIYIPPRNFAFSCKAFALFWKSIALPKQTLHFLTKKLCSHKKLPFSCKTRKVISTYHCSFQKK